MGLRAPILAAAILATLPGQLRSCGQDDVACIDVRPGQCMVRSFLQDEDLCGGEETAVECFTDMPVGVNDHLAPWEPVAQVATLVVDTEHTAPGAWQRVGSWIFWIPRDGDPIAGQMRTRMVPPHHGDPIPIPFAALRGSDEVLQEGVTRMSAYQRTSDIRLGCIINRAVVWTWTLRAMDDDIFADDLDAAVKVVGLEGDCQQAGLPSQGYTYRLRGKLYRPDG